MTSVGTTPTTSWPPCEAPALPSPGSVDIYRFSIDQPDNIIRSLTALLADDEIERARRFAFVHLRNRFIAGRAGLRAALGSMVGVAPRELRFSYGTNGKPALTDTRTAISFNLSHSDGVALLAVTDAADIGVDIEAIRASDDLDDVAARFFSSHEQQELAEYGATDRADAFFRCWTRKEAIIKAIGEGLSLPLAEFDVTIRPGDARLLRLFDRDRPTDWTLTDLDPGPGWAGAIAVRAPGARSTVWSWEPWAALARPAEMLH